MELSSKLELARVTKPLPSRIHWHCPDWIGDDQFEFELQCIFGIPHACNFCAHLLELPFLGAFLETHFLRAFFHSGLFLRQCISGSVIPTFPPSSHLGIRCKVPFSLFLYCTE